MKTYCVHVYEHPHEYESVRAKNAGEAEYKVMKREWNGDYENISNVEVMRECPCGTDNDLDNKKCENCRKKL